MKWRTPVALATFCLGFSAWADEIADWARAQGRAYQSYLDRRAAAPPGAQLWRERTGPDPVIPGFVPPTSLAPLVKAVSPGVVNVSSVWESPGPAPARRSLGSGFVISPDGFVVTNNHVVEAAQAIAGGRLANKSDAARLLSSAQILVQLADGREYLAEVVGRDDSTDVALLRLQGAPGDLPSVYLGDSDALAVGDWVVAIGNPFGLDHSVAHGMISAKERVLGIGAFDDFIQTDTLINPGNSGGPLFNMRGEVIGVNTAIISQGQGIGFAVPINMVKELIPNLRENGRLARGWLGVRIVESEDGTRPGASISAVYTGSPAEAAGLQTGDRVLAVNGRAVENFQQLLRRVSFLAPGTRAVLQVERRGKRQEIPVTLSERPAPQPRVAAGASDALGLVLRDLTAGEGAGAGIASGGALVTAVLPGSPADRAGLRAGDVINEANRHPVRTVAEFRSAVGRDDAKGAVLVRYQRGDSVRYVAIDSG
jgi:serine protease Do